LENVIGRCNVRYAKVTDIPAIYEVLGDTKVNYGVFFENLKDWPCVVCERHDGTITGCGFADYVEKGNYASIHVIAGKMKPFEIVKAAREGVRLLFNVLDVHTLRAFININHKHTHTLAKRLGFRYEGILYDYRKVNGEWTDFSVFSMKEG